MTRPKPFLTYFVLCAIPLLLLAGLNYWNGIKSVDSTISTIVQNDLNAFNVAIDEELEQRKRAILQVAMAPGTRRIVTRKEVELSEILPESPYLILNTVPNLGEQFQSLTLFDNEQRIIWSRKGNGGWTFIENTADLAQPDPSVWLLQGNVSVEKPGKAPATREYTAPIHDEKGTSNVGAVVGVLDLESVFTNAARGLERRSNAESIVVALDRSGNILYHSDRSLKLRPASEALPGFNSMLTAMTANESGLDQFRSPSGVSYMTAYTPIPNLNIAVAIARSRSPLISDAHVSGITGLVLALLGALAAAWILDRHIQRRTRGIARVTEDVSAIAKGELDRRIILQSSDDARVLADNINVVTEQLRAKIEREEESRQFESFVRISAMLTHDLKNAIEALSLTVSNMERHFDNPQFRADAMKGLTSATDKLKALVARLGKPLTSLSGEHKRPQNVDLVPIMQRVIAMTAEPMRSKHTIVTRLPSNLYALVDAARIEEVMENLVLNALEAMDKGGILTIEAGQTPTGAPTFSVADTGCGMSRKFIETRLFRPFSTTKKTGIGLGLYTCREVIEASAGSIKVESVEGAGTTFHVVLPSLPNDRRSQEAARQ
ncbi:MAG TPA: ATP-binding protein [Pyrinomonadaceae bacterium]